MTSTVALVAAANVRTGTAARFCYVAQDTTAQKEAERALAESERRATVLSEATFEGIAFSRGGGVLDANEQFAHLVGYESVDEIIGVDALSVVAPESQARVRAMIGEGRTEAYEAEILRRDGTRFWAEV